MIVIQDELINSVIARAETSPRKRMNYNFHPQLDDPLQRMLNCLEPGSYIRPHKHENPDKYEAFVLLKGKVLVVEFDNKGDIASHVILSAELGKYGAEIAPRIFHAIIPLEKGTVVYEIKNGPYSPLNDKNFADWAPEEGSPDCADYMDNLIRRTIHVKQ
jgi:cupin fold WbuC family metalloprotein